GIEQPGDLTPDTENAPALTINANGQSGNIFVTENSTVVTVTGGDTRHGIVLNPGDGGDYTFDIDGKIFANDQGADGIRVTNVGEADNITIDVSTGGEVRGKDDGITVHAVSGLLKIDNAGLI